MRSVLFVICAGLLAAGALLAVGTAKPGRLAAASADVPPDKAALGKTIREYLLANPEVLVEAMQELERKQDGQRDAVAQKGVQENQAELFRDADSPIGGNPNGDVVIVDFNDYQCPYCKRTHQAMKSVVAADGKVKTIYKDLPILGEASKVAALAALASVKQGKHTAFHNALMEFSGKLDRDKILEIAGSVGIDRAQLEKDMEDPKLKRTIERNLRAGERARHPRHAGLRDRQAVRARRRRRRGAEAADRRRPQELARQGRREPEQAHEVGAGLHQRLEPFDVDRRLRLGIDGERAAALDEARDGIEQLGHVLRNQHVGRLVAADLARQIGARLRGRLAGHRRQRLQAALEQALVDQGQPHFTQACVRLVEREEVAVIDGAPERRIGIDDPAR